MPACISRHRLHRCDRVRSARASSRNAARLRGGCGARPGGDTSARRGLVAVRARPRQLAACRQCLSASRSWLRCSKPYRTDRGVADRSADSGRPARGRRRRSCGSMHCRVARAWLPRGRDRLRHAQDRRRPAGSPRAGCDPGAPGARHRLMTEYRARLPAVDRVLRSEAAGPLIAQYGRPLVLDTVRKTLAERRLSGKAASVAAVIEASAASLARTMQPSQRQVFNLTGTVLHTNLGRASLPNEAIAAAAAAMRDPTTLEYDLATGSRGERDNHIAGWLTRLTGAEAALAVNNNAAALVLALNTLAEGRETIVSRGELIEIGGSFRLPEIMARAGTKLREVGTTNRTHLADYAAAIGPETGLILKAHTSNYVVQGFTAATPAAKLAALAREHAIPFVEDLGSGSLVDFERWGLPHEPTVTEALAQGADLV